jgi:hypothetical protein
MGYDDDGGGKFRFHFGPGGLIDGGSVNFKLDH